MRSVITNRDRSRPGIALVLVLVALSVVGALAAGAFLLAWRDLAAGTRAVQRARAFSAAELGLQATLAAWDPRWTAAPMGLVAVQQRSLEDSASDTVRVWKLGSSSAMIVSEGIAARPPHAAQRRLNLLVALRPLGISVGAALVARETVVVRGGARISGVAALDASADCPPDSSSHAAVAVPDTGLVDTAGCGATPCVDGAPPVLVTPLDPASDPAAYLGLDRERLIALARPVAVASLTPRPTINARGTCDLDDPLNLGDPAAMLGDPSPCSRWAAPRYAAGDLRIDGGTGQGLLIVDGNLTLAGGARFAGIVLVRGTLRVEGASRLEGAAVAEQALLDNASVLRFASCPIYRARLGAAQPSRETGLSWVEHN